MDRRRREGGKAAYPYRGCRRVLRRVIEGLGVPSSESSIIFVENGQHSWNDAAEAIASVGKKLGVLDTEQVKQLTLEEAAKTLGTEDINYVEVAYAST